MPSLAATAAGGSAARRQQFLPLPLPLLLPAAGAAASAPAAAAGRALARQARHQCVGAQQGQAGAVGQVLAGDHVLQVIQYGLELLAVLLEGGQRGGAGLAARATHLRAQLRQVHWVHRKAAGRQVAHAAIHQALQRDALDQAAGLRLDGVLQQRQRGGAVGRAGRAHLQRRRQGLRRGPA